MRHAGCCKGRESNKRRGGGLRVCCTELFVLKIWRHLAQDELKFIDKKSSLSLGCPSKSDDDVHAFNCDTLDD